MQPFTHTIRPGRLLVRHSNAHEYLKHVDVFCRIQWDGRRLSFFGVEGPREAGGAWGAVGQIFLHLGDGTIIDPAPQWSHDLIARFLQLWAEWHLNDLSAECDHQRALGWRQKALIELPGARKTLGWLTPAEHPEGLLTRPCPVCGYRYGTEWRIRPVPEYVLEFLSSLPETDKKPEWI